jgi:hypothetical protein
LNYSAGFDIRPIFRGSAKETLTALLIFPFGFAARAAFSNVALVCSDKYQILHAVKAASLTRGHTNVTDDGPALLFANPPPTARKPGFALWQDATHGKRARADTRRPCLMSRPAEFDTAAAQTQ